MSNELDIPQVSIGRYLELLKRRWWQVIPVTLFGLVAGAVAAFLIPRYYVAKTVFTFKGGEILDTKAGIDPMAAVATNAQLSIPQLAEETARDLGWPEAVDEDPERQRSFVDAVKGRVLVQTPQQTAFGLNQLNLTIFYKDTNGERAAAFANRIRELWIEKERKRIEAGASISKDQINREVRRLEQAKRELETSLRNHFEINRDVLVSLLPNEQRNGARGGGNSPMPDGGDAIEEANKRDQLTTVIARIEGLKQRIQVLGDQLSTGEIQRTITRVLEASPDPAQEAAFRKLEQALDKAKEAANNLQPGNPKRELRDRAVAALEVKFLEALKSRDKSRTIQETNPDYTVMYASLENLRGELAEAEAQRKVIASRLETIREKRTNWPTIWSTYQAYQGDLEEIQQKLEVANIDQRTTLKKFDRLRSARNFEIHVEAVIPPRPTDPNIFLVAALGSLIGLATAIGLILLLDFLQSAFKTVDDVERALPVPVLGTLAHLETQEERVYNVSQRRRISLAAGVLLFLSLSVIAIYFVNPTLLPPPVMNLLDLILGAN